MSNLKWRLTKIKNKLIGRLVKSEIESLFTVRNNFVNSYNDRGDGEDLVYAYCTDQLLINICYDYGIIDLFDKHHYFYELDIRNN